MADNLNPTYVSATNDEQRLMKKWQKYMYVSQEKTLLTGREKALVCAFQATFNLQKIYQELQGYAKLSTTACMVAASLLSYNNTFNLEDGKWKGITHAYNLHWQDHACEYHDLTPTQVLADNLQCILLANAVHPAEELRAINLHAEQHNMYTGVKLTY